MGKTLEQFKKMLDFKGKYVSVEDFRVLLEFLVAGMDEHKLELAKLTKVQQDAIFEEVKDYMGMVEGHFNRSSTDIGVIADTSKAEIVKYIEDIKLFWESIKDATPKDGAKGDKGDAGKDADEEAVIKAVLDRMPVISPFVLEGQDIVDRINDLPTDKDEYKIDWKHIKNVPKFHQKPFIYPLHVDGGGSGGSQNLQQVTDIGADTTNTMQVHNLASTVYTDYEAGGATASSTLNGTRTHFLATSNAAQGVRQAGVFAWDNDEFLSGILFLKSDTGESWLMTKSTAPAFDSGTIFLPDAPTSSVLAVSVNGNFANDVGEITLSGVITALTDGSGTTVGSDLTSVDLGGTITQNTGIDFVNTYFMGFNNVVGWGVNTATYSDGLLQVGENGFWYIGDAVANVGGTSVVGDDAAQTIILTAHNGFTVQESVETIQRDNLTTTRTDALVLLNATPSTNAVRVQISPSLRLSAGSWTTGSGGAAHTVDWDMHVLPVTATTTARGQLTFGYSIDGAAFTEAFRLDTLNGAARIAGSLTVVSNILSAGVTTTGALFINSAAAPIQLGVAGDPGTSGFIMVSQGAGNTPIWQSGASAGFVTSVTTPNNSLVISPTTGAVTADINLNHSNVWTSAPQAVQQFLLGTTTVNGFYVENPSVAAAGAQQVSPSFRWTGQGWKTDATAGTQTVDFQAYINPIQGAANPSVEWILQSQINGGGYVTQLKVDSNGDITPTRNIVLNENSSIVLDPSLSADGKYNGITRAGTAGTTLAFGDLIYLDPTDSRWELADANSAQGADGDARGILGICVLAAAADGSPTLILLYGTVRADASFPSMTINNQMYVSETAGDITGTQPSTADVVIRVVGFATTADELFFCPSSDYITHI